jgi:predicted component of type VI protein secretion system
MPSENMDGPKLDSGSTLLKAMESFKPEQITAMSSDTKQLLETQKSLMSMLNQMRPVLADGKELLQTFSGMFGGAGGAFKL